MAEAPERRLDGLRFYIGTGPLGVGLFAAAALPVGAVILRFRGSRLSFAEAAGRGSDECYTLQVDHDEYLDLEGPARLVNHSCQPNAGIIGEHLVALARIPMHTEIRFDYSTTMDEDYWTMACACTMPNCRRRVKDFKHLPLRVRQHYLELGIVQPFIAVQYSANGRRLAHQNRRADGNHDHHAFPDAADRA